jgi:hypothetical protein
VICLDAGISIKGSLLGDAAPGVAITAASQAALVVTITTAQAHQLNIGDVVNVQNVGVAGYNGLQTVQTVPALNQFTYVLGAGGLGNSSGGSANLSPSQAYILLNSAYRTVQDEIANLGYETPKKEATLVNITAMPVAVRDVNTRCFINYTEYFDGQNILTPAHDGAPVLPPDLMAPLVLKERIHQTGALFSPMDQARDGLPLRPQQPFLRVWDWIDDALYFIGSTQALDVWMKYQAFFPALNTATDQIKIFHGGEAIAYTLANRFSAPRGGEAAGHFDTEAKRAIQTIVNRSNKKQSRKDARRQPYGGGHASGWNDGHYF